MSLMQNYICDMHDKKSHHINDNAKKSEGKDNAQEGKDNAQEGKDNAQEGKDNAQNVLSLTQNYTTELHKRHNRFEGLSVMRNSANFRLMD